jgi:hypothetical protein
MEKDKQPTGERELNSTDKIMIGLISAVCLITCAFIFLKIMFL